MKHYILDANALVRFVRGIEGADKVRSIFRQHERGAAQISMSAVNLGEAYYILMRHLGEATTAKTINLTGHVVSFVPVKVALAIEAARIKERYKMGYADSFAAALALRGNRILVSADPDFEKLGKSIKLLRLPSHAKN